MPAASARTCWPGVSALQARENHVAGAQRLATNGKRSRQAGGRLERMTNASGTCPDRGDLPVDLEHHATAVKVQSRQGLRIAAEHKADRRAIVGDGVGECDLPIGDGLSTISIAATANATAPATSCTRGSALITLRPRTSATSTSALGCSSPGPSRPPSATRMSSKSTAKSGRSTPSCCCTALAVRPILRPTIRLPSVSQKRVLRSCTA